MSAMSNDPTTPTDPFKNEPVDDPPTEPADPQPADPGDYDD